MLLEDLLETYPIYTLFEKQVPENSHIVNMAFVIQSVPDIHDKLQKFHGFAGMTIISCLRKPRKCITIERKRNGDFKKKNTRILMAIYKEVTQLGTGGKQNKGKWPQQRGHYQYLDLDQCDFCKKKEHFK